MKRQIRKHARVFAAILFLFVGALALAGYLLSNQRFYLPGWVPVIGTEFFELEAELPTAQAVVPGQGQTVNIAGVKVGEVGRVELEEGRAIVTMQLQEEHDTVYRNATILLRPKTGLKDMYLALDPGTKNAGRLDEGDRVPVSNTLPDVDADEVLAQLDTDTRDYLRILLNAGGTAFREQPGEEQSPAQDLRETLKRFEPLSRNGARITRQLSKRRANIERVIHNFQLLSTELASKDRQLAALVDSANANFEALASEEASIREALRLFPPALSQTETTLTKAGGLAAELGPALQRLRPFARELAPALRRTRPFLRETTPIIRDQIRPFARDAQPAVRELRAAAGDLGAVTPRLTRTFGVLNRLFNMLAYEPPGASDSFLFWASWGAHAGTSLFTTQDAHGPIRRGAVFINCPSYPVLRGIVAGSPRLGMLTRLLNPVPERQVCPNNFVPPGQTPIGELP
ncbi:MAG TPA: MlaD family protein [Thermoleophilaceae bacterium]|nr:MlaD family protein [Thermoleophilaceae bacterium]